jgi:hypothetical protein
LNAKKKSAKEHERKKESRDAALLRGTEDLLQSGLDLENLEVSTASIRRLTELSFPSIEGQRAVACWLGFAELPESVSLLLAMEAKVSDKELRREIRRSLFRLEQRGLQVPHPEVQPEARPLAKEVDRGFISPVDARGDQVVWYVKEEGSGDYFILSGVVNDRQGLLEADAGRVARPALRDLLEGTHRKFSLRMVQADAAWCDFVLHEAYKRSRNRRHPGVAHFPAYRMEISHQIPEPIPSPVRALLAEEKPRTTSDWLDSSQRLLDEKELAGWVLEEEWTRPHLDKILEASESPLVLSRFQKEERMERALREAGLQIFSGEARALYAARLEAMAYYFYLDGRDDVARHALGVSAAMAEGSGEVVAKLPLVLELTRRSLKMLEGSLRRKEQEEQGPSLIVKPTQR